MDGDLKRFFESIGFNYQEEIFKNTKILKVRYLKEKAIFEVYLESRYLLPFSEVQTILNLASKGIRQKNKCVVYFSYTIKTLDDVLIYLKALIQELVNERPSLINLLESKIEIDDEIITLEVASKLEEMEMVRVNKRLENQLHLMGLGDFKITTVVNDAMNASLKEDLEKSRFGQLDKKEVVVYEHQAVDSDAITPLHNIMGIIDHVTSEAYVFGIEGKEFEKTNLITLKVSDKTDSILVKIWKKQKEDYEQALNEFKENSWYRFSGKVVYDEFCKDLVFMVHKWEAIPTKEEMITEKTECPRVELHTHTMMSAMDGVIDAKTLVKHAYKMGQRAIGVVDHNCCQAFPDLFHAVGDINKGKEEKDKFKVLYGAEMNVVADEIDVITHPKTYTFLEDTFVVFDTETTGLYAGKDTMIEIGAVKIRNGEILDRFDQLIDPGRPIPSKITEITFITDEMVKGCPDEETVTKQFIEWVGDLPLVAHNAKFDISMMCAAFNKYHLGEFSYTVIDTMGLARILHPEWMNHKLSTLTKKLDVPWDEEKHHRADYDAEGTAIAFYKMSKAFDDQNVSTTDDLMSSFDIESLIKFARPFHVTLLAKNREGLKNLFKIISIANTKYLYKNDAPKIPRQEVERLREGLLIGSACINGEVFKDSLNKEDEEMVNMMSFYDYIEVQPVSAFIHLIGEDKKFLTEKEAQKYLKRIVDVAKTAGKMVVATGDVHNLKKEDKIYREIVINQKFNGKLHPLNYKGQEIPNMYLKTTEEMMEDFSFLGDALSQEIVVENTNKIAYMCEEIEVIIDTPNPFAPKIPKSVETMTQLVYERADELYGHPLPLNIEERLAKELYGDAIIKACLEEEKEEGKAFSLVHTIINQGKEAVKECVKKHLSQEEIEDKNEEERDKLAYKKLGGIIGANYDVIYLIAQKLVKHSNDEGFLVGSRGSVGSSFVANMMGITEVNSLPAHYRCPKCKHSVFNDEEGVALGVAYSCGFDLPDKMCPLCGEKMAKDGHDIPFATFLGFNADKVPDIDLNFSDLNQASAHDYTKVLFGVDNVYRAGTIGTVAEKTAVGYVLGYCEAKGITMRKIETERLAVGCTGVKRTTGQHPGGIVVIPDYMEVYDFTPFQFPSDDPSKAWRTTHFDYHAIDADVLKLDILGHTDPTQLRMIQDITGDDVTEVPLDDKETMALFTGTDSLGVTPEQIMCDTGTLGVPEFGTGFTIQLVKDAKPTTFAELVKISGLAHGTNVWLGNAQELIRKNICPFKDVIGCRDDIMVELMNKGVPPIKAFKIMEFVRKGKASKKAMQEEWQGYVEILKEYQIPDWYIESCQKIKYMFPKAHAAAYVTSAFRIAWYKVHKPIVYYGTYFSTRFQDFDPEVMTKGYEAIKEKMIEIKGQEKLSNKDESLLETLKLALEATARGIKFKMIDIEKSDGKNFVIDFEENALYMPFCSLEGLGDSVAAKIIEERQIKSFYCIEDFQNRGKVNATTVEKMKLLDIFKGLPETSQLSLF